MPVNSISMTFSAFRLCMCVITVLQCSKHTLMFLDVRLCECVCAWTYFTGACMQLFLRCALVTSCCSSHHPCADPQLFLKVTNQDRWPFGKIKDTFLKKRCVWFITQYHCCGGGMWYKGWDFSRHPGGFNLSKTLLNVTHLNGGSETEGGETRGVRLG